MNNIYWNTLYGKYNETIMVDVQQALLKAYEEAAAEEE